MQSSVMCLTIPRSIRQMNSLEELETLPPDAQKRIIQIVELMIEQEKNNRK